MGPRSQNVIGSLDLRLRIVASLFALSLFTPVAGAAPAAVGALGVLLSYLAFGQPLPWKRLLHLEGYLVLLFLTLPFTLPGEPLLHVGSLVASEDGVWRALTLALKVTASVLLLSLLLGTSEPMHLGVALRGLHVPESLVRLFVNATRNVGLVREELSRLHEAMRVRSFYPRSNRHTWRSYGYLFGMMFVRTMGRAERVEEAMRLRGYSSRFPHTELPKPVMLDWLVAGLIVLGAGLLLVWDRW
jgi:cobalt/nickel transport system permease protein